jgi:hypothetical protein
MCRLPDFISSNVVPNLAGDLTLEAHFEGVARAGERQNGRDNSSVRVSDLSQIPQRLDRSG